MWLWAIFTRAQNVGVNARYCGTPLGYSFSEAGQEKSVTIVTLGEKGCVERTAIPLTPLHGLREVRGNYLDLARRKPMKALQWKIIFWRR